MPPRDVGSTGVLVPVGGRKFHCFEIHPPGAVEVSSISTVPESLGIQVALAEAFAETVAM